MSSTASNLTLGGAFGRIDAADGADAFVQCLDVQHGLDATLAWKRRAFAQMRLAPGGSALDVGCGTGEDAQVLASIVGRAGRVVGVDNSESMIAEARARTSDAPARMEFHVGDAAALPLPEDHFDAAHAERVLVHAREPDAVVAEMSRVVRPGGRVVATEPDMETYIVNASDTELTRRIMHFICDSMASGWIGRRLHACFRSAGLIDVAVQPEVQFVTDPAVGARLFGLDRAVAGARAAGVVDEAEARRWLADLDALAAKGHYGGGCTLFTVSGTRP